MLSKISEDELLALNVNAREQRNFCSPEFVKNVQKNEIRFYLGKRKITPTSITIFPSRRQRIISAKVHIPSTSCLDVPRENFFAKICEMQALATKRIR